VFLVFAAFAVLSQMRFDMRDVHSLGDYYGFVLGFFFNGLESSMKVVSDVPGRVDYLHGKTVVAAVYQFIPSVIWPEKPTGTLAADAWLTSEIFGLDPRIVLAIPPIIAELYWNYGFWIVVVGMFGFGYLFKRFDSGLLKIDLVIWVMFFAGLAPLTTHLVRGPIGNWTIRLVSDLVAFFFIFVAYRMSVRPPSSGSTDHTPQ
jgi:hypothetical protein